MPPELKYQIQQRLNRNELTTLHYYRIISHIFENRDKILDQMIILQHLSDHLFSEYSYPADNDYLKELQFDCVFNSDDYYDNEKLFEGYSRRRLNSTRTIWCKFIHQYDNTSSLSPLIICIKPKEPSEKFKVPIISPRIGIRRLPGTYVILANEFPLFTDIMVEHISIHDNCRLASNCTCHQYHCSINFINKYSLKIAQHLVASIS